MKKLLDVSFENTMDEFVYVSNTGYLEHVNITHSTTRRIIHENCDPKVRNFAYSLCKHVEEAYAFHNPYLDQNQQN